MGIIVNMLHILFQNPQPNNESNFDHNKPFTPIRLVLKTKWKPISNSLLLNLIIPSTHFPASAQAPAVRKFPDWSSPCVLIP